MSSDLNTRFPSPFDSPGFVLWRISVAWQARQQGALKPFGLTHTQYVVLTTLCWACDENEGMNQRSVADASSIDPMTTSQVVRKLEAAGLVERVPDPADKRAYLVIPTRSGRDLANVTTPVVEKVDQAVFDQAGMSGVRESLLHLGAALADEERN